MADTRRQIIADANAGVGFPNPFDRVARAIAERLMLQPAFAALVKTGNLIRYDTLARDPAKDQRQDGDLPEVAIEPAGVGLDSHAASDIVRVVAAYAVVLRTGDDRLSVFHYPLLWAILCAVVDWNRTDDQAVPFVTRLRTSEAGIARGSGDYLDAEGWSTILTIEAECVFDRDAMRHGAVLGG